MPVGDSPRHRRPRNYSDGTPPGLRDADGVTLPVPYLPAAVAGILFGAGRCNATHLYHPPAPTVLCSVLALPAVTGRVGGVAVLPATG